MQNTHDGPSHTTPPGPTENYHGCSSEVALTVGHLEVHARLLGALHNLLHVGLVRVGPAAAVALGALRRPAEHARVRPLQRERLAVDTRLYGEVAEQPAEEGEQRVLVALGREDARRVEGLVGQDGARGRPAALGRVRG